MEGPQETEFKFLLTESQYGVLEKELGAPLRSRSLVNRYFVPAEPVERRDWVLRLRLEDHRKELTLKIGREIQPGLFDSTEYNELVDSEDPDDWEGCRPLRVFREGVSESALRVQGESRTLRHVFAPPVEVGKAWEVDRCELPGGKVFYELEVEVEGRGPFEKQRETLLDWLAGIGIRPEVSQKTKYARFLEATLRNPA